MKKKKKMSLQKRKHNLNGYLFLAPWLIGFLIFTGIPFLYTFYLSFTNVSSTALGYEIEFIGFKHYYDLFLANIHFGPALIRFIIMQLLYVPVILVVSFILGLLLNQEIRFRAIFRMIFFFPVIILSGAVMQQFITSGVTSISDINDVIVYKIVANYSPLLARGIAILFINFTLVLWFTGIPIILFINALQKIDRGLYEAAQIDGANWWQILWKITIPMIKSTAMVISIYTIVNLGLYNINPLGDEKLTIFQLIKTALGNTSDGLGIASAYSSIYSIVVLLLVGFVMFIFRERDTVKKQESLQEKQLRNLRRIQKRNASKRLTTSYYINRFVKIFKKVKGGKHSE